MNEYKYNNEIPANVEKPMNVNPIIGIMDKNCAIANEALLMVRSINMCLFGGAIPEDRHASPSCFSEALQLQNETLNMLLEELIRMADRLGM